MIRAVTLLAILCALSSCASDTRGVKLANIDLGDAEAVQEIRARLSPQDRGAFNDYVLMHRISSESFCGKALVRPDGKAPETVGEAIDLAAVRDAEDRLAMKAASRPKHPRELAQQKWDELVSERDMLIDAQSVLRIEHGQAAERLSEWSAIKAKLADVDKRLIAMKPKVFGSSV
jgi:hypothetical protein